MIDCVVYAGELDMLRLRVDTLRGIVQRHVVVEARQTFTGRPRAVDLDARRAELATLHAAITYYLVDLVGNLAPFDREARQRDVALRGLADVPDAVPVLVGDVDEIPDPDALPAMLPLSAHGPMAVCVMTHHAYDARNVRVQPAGWQGTVITTADVVRRHGVEGVRRRRDVIPEVACGWHYTHMGSLERLEAKITGYSHTEYATPDVLAALPARRAAGQDPFGREEYYRWDDQAPRPAPLWRDPARYPMVWRDDPPEVRDAA